MNTINVNVLLSQFKEKRKYAQDHAHVIQSSVYCTPFRIRELILVIVSCCSSHFDIFDVSTVAECSVKNNFQVCWCQSVLSFFRTTSCSTSLFRIWNTLSRYMGQLHA